MKKSILPKTNGVTGKVLATISLKKYDAQIIRVKIWDDRENIEKHFMAEIKIWQHKIVILVKRCHILILFNGQGSSMYTIHN